MPPRKTDADFTADYLNACIRDWQFMDHGSEQAPLVDSCAMFQGIERSKPIPQEDGKKPRKAPPQERQETLSPPLPIGKALLSGEHLVLLGEPGSGKSTLLQWIGLSFASRQLDRLGIQEERIPVLISLPKWKDQLGAAEARMETSVLMPIIYQKLSTELAFHYQNTLYKIVLSWLRNGRLILLIDGLDEVPVERRSLVLDCIYRFSATGEGQKTRILLTSRPNGFQSLRDFQEFRMIPFQTAEDTLPYLENWIATRHKEPDAAQRAAMLLDGLKSSNSFHEIIANPLLLRLAAQIYAEQETIVPSRFKLYQKYIEEVAWQLRPETDQLHGDQRAKILEDLETMAWRLQSQPEALQEDREPALYLYAEKLGLLMGWGNRGQEPYTFTHKTFQEYFLARRLIKAWGGKDSREWAWKTLRPRLHDPAWRQPLLLMSDGLEQEKDAVELIRRVYAARSRWNYFLQRDLDLALSLIAARNWTDLPEKIWKIIIGSYRLISTGSWEENGLIPALRLAGDRNLDIVRIVLTSSRHISRRGAVKALGQLGDPAAVPDLLKALYDPSDRVRHQAVQALAQIGDQTVVPDLLDAFNDPKNPWRLGYTDLEALGQLGGPEAIAWLLRTVYHSDPIIRYEAALVLARTGDLDTVRRLIDYLYDADSLARWGASQGLKQAGTAFGDALGAVLQEAFQDPFEQALRDILETNRIEAGLPGDLEGLLKALEGGDPSQRAAAANALGHFYAEDPQAKEGLFQALHDPNEIVRYSAANALGETGDARALKVLLSELKDLDHRSRFLAISAIAKINDPLADKALIRAFGDISPENRSLARSLARESLVGRLERLSVGDLRTAIRAWILLNDERQYDVIKPYVAELDIRTTPPLANPLAPPPITGWQKAARAAGFGLVFFFLLTLVSLIGLFSSEVFSEFFDAIRSQAAPWIQANPWLAFLVVLVILLTGQLLGLAVKWLPEKMARLK